MDRFSSTVATAPGVRIFTSSVIISLLNQHRIVQRYFPIPPDVLRDVGPFYHITSASNYESIRQHGLQPSRWDEGAYFVHADSGIQWSFVCLTPESHSRRYLATLRNGKYEHEEVVLLRIDAETVATRRIALDPTTTELDVFRQMHRTDDVRRLIDAGVPLVCYDQVPSDSILLVERFPAVRDR